MLQIQWRHHMTVRPRDPRHASGVRMRIKVGPKRSLVLLGLARAGNENEIGEAQGGAWGPSSVRNLLARMAGQRASFRLCPALLP
jgi:hypothetical protein